MTKYSFSVADPVGQDPVHQKYKTEFGFDLKKPPNPKGNIYCNLFGPQRKTKNFFQLFFNFIFTIFRLL